MNGKGKSAGTASFEGKPTAVATSVGGGGGGGAWHKRSKSDADDADTVEGGEASNGGSDSGEEDGSGEEEEAVEEEEGKKPKKKKEGKFGGFMRRVSGKKDKDKEKDKEKDFQIGGPNNFRHVTAVKGDDAMAFFSTVQQTGNIPNQWSTQKPAPGSCPVSLPPSPQRSATLSSATSMPSPAVRDKPLRRSMHGVPGASNIRKDRASLKVDEALNKSQKMRKKLSSDDTDKVKSKDKHPKEKQSSEENDKVKPKEKHPKEKRVSGSVEKKSSGDRKSIHEKKASSDTSTKTTERKESPKSTPPSSGGSAKPAPPPPAQAVTPPPSPGSTSGSSTAVQPRWHIHPDAVDIGEKLGEGGCAVVYKGSWCGIDVAVKRLVYPTEKMVTLFSNEIQIMSELRHPRIIQFLGACLTPEQIFFVLEWAPHGDLHRVVNKDNPSWKQRLTWAIEMAQGLLYLHSQNILHMDIKSLNMLIDENYHLKVADFGLAKAMVKSDVTVQDLGSIKWLAPEVHETEHFTKQTDIYSFGMVLWELITGQYPFGELTPMKTVVASMQGQRPVIPEGTDKGFSALMEKCWAQDPAARPDIAGVLAALKAVPMPSSS